MFRARLMSITAAVLLFSDPETLAWARRLVGVMGLTAMAAVAPQRMAVAAPLGKRRPGVRRRYEQVTFEQLEEDSNRIATGLQALGAGPGMKLVLMVRPGVNFISLVFALFKTGAVIVLT